MPLEKFSRSSIFTKAYKEYHGCMIKKTDESEKMVCYEVEDFISGKIHQVFIVYDEHRKIVRYSCDCTIQSLKSQYMILCSHVIGVISFSMFNIGRRKGRRKPE